MFARALGWLLTGPLGHLLAAVIDWARIARKVAAAKLRGREVDW